VRSDLPAGTVTFLFTDVEGSTKLLRDLGAEAYADARAEHRRIVREACAAGGGVEVDTQGDAFFVAFPSAPGAAAAAEAITDALLSGPISLRIGLHTGTPLVTDEGYVGDDVHFAARVAASGHGRQILLSKSARELVDGLSVTDLGEHRLKDIEGSVSIYQLGDETFPPLKTISNTNLPRPASSFIGREREREEVVRELRDGVRLLTLTGPGGSGKTRLAVEVAATLVPEYKAGVFWVGLASVREPSLVTEQIAQTLGSRDGLAEHIGGREMLLLLDNLEQVIEAAPDLSALAAACPNLALLVTSRELLRVQGEVEYSVPPLASSEAVALFCERSRLEATAEIAELCNRLDDLPLAVELAAARTMALSPTQILERLSQRLDLLKGGRDAEARQQTLRATIAWSYDLLSQEEQRVFRALSVFAGGCRLDAAEEVAGADLDTLQSLVEKSLLRFTNERYWMLETIREYAAELLQNECEDSEILERHTGWYLRLAKSAHGELRGPSQGEWFALLNAELENLRSAIRWAEERDERLEVELAGATWFFLAMRGLLREALGYLVHAIETAEEDPSLDQSELLYGASFVSSKMGDYDAMRRWSEQRLELARARKDTSMIARSLTGLALAAEMQDDRERARTLYLEAADLARECGDTQSLTIVAANLGVMALTDGDAETARTHLERSLELVRERSNAQGEAAILSYLALVALAEGDTDEARALLGSSLRLASSVGDREAIFGSLLGLAEVAARSGGMLHAARLLGAADALREEVGYGPPDPSERELRTRIANVLDENDPALVAAQSEGGALTLDEAIELGLSLIDRAKTSGRQTPSR
jgi:predicted ATPase